MGFPDTGNGAVIFRGNNCVCGVSTKDGGPRGIGVALASSGVCTHDRVGSKTSCVARTYLSPSNRHLIIATHNRIFGLPIRGNIAGGVAHSPKTRSHGTR